MLNLVATPIGNLGDITLRALETLRAADLVVSEDTRKTGTLLHHFDIRKPQLSFREDNEAKALPRVMNALREGLNVALVSDQCIAICYFAVLLSMTFLPLPSYLYSDRKSVV